MVAILSAQGQDLSRADLVRAVFKHAHLHTLDLGILSDPKSSLYTPEVLE
jgi:uncharacterized protein YjbI with pentapeptide repeats